MDARRNVAERQLPHVFLRSYWRSRGEVGTPSPCQIGPWRLPGIRPRSGLEGHHRSEIARSRGPEGLTRGGGPGDVLDHVLSDQVFVADRVALRESGPAEIDMVPPVSITAPKTRPLVRVVDEVEVTVLDPVDVLTSSLTRILEAELHIRPAAQDELTSDFGCQLSDDLE